ncbi:spore germination protein [Cytobacillus spongiae]|jgi:hypothetical protein|uniref:spore germination protein n=1 Tax=Cytobacillus spongiae TaxID=2901381 RepID=UPI003D798E6A
MNVSIESIHVNTVTENSSVAVGQNYQLYWRSNSKLNVGLGNTVGEYNWIVSNQNVVYDNDLIDMPINNSSSS